MSGPGFKLRQIAGGQWIKLVDGVVVGLASTADIEAWQVWLASDDEANPASGPSRLYKGDIEVEEQAVMSPVPTATAKAGGSPETGFIGWLEVAPWRDVQYRPGETAEAGFLERAIRRFAAKFGTAPNVLHVRADHKTLIYDGQNRPAIAAAPELPLTVATDPFVLPGTYRLAWMRTDDRS